MVSNDIQAEEQASAAFVRSDEFIDAVLEEAQSVAGLRPPGRERRYRRPLRGSFGPTSDGHRGRAVDMIDGEALVTPNAAETTHDLPTDEPLSTDDGPSDVGPSDEVPGDRFGAAALAIDELPRDDLSEDLLAFDAVPLGEIPSGESPWGDVSADEVVLDVTDRARAEELADAAESLVAVPWLDSLADEPVDEAPANDEPANDEPANEAPSVAVAEDAAVEEPVVEELVVEEPVAEEPMVEEPIAAGGPAVVDPAPAVIEYERPPVAEVKHRRYRLRRMRHDFREFMIRRGGGAPRTSLLSRWRRARLRQQRMRRNAATQAALLGYESDGPSTPEV